MNSHLSQESSSSRGREKSGAANPSSAVEEAERLGKFLSALPVGVYACDAEGRIIYYNKRAAELWGREPKLNDAMERFCASYRAYTPEGKSIAPEEAPTAVALRDGTSFAGLESIIERPDGSRFSASVSIQVIRGQDGKIEGVVNVLQALPDLNPTQKALRDSEEKFRTIADNISQLAWMADAKGNLLWYNRRWFEYTGTDLEQMRGWGWKKVHHPDHVQRVEDKWRAHLQNGVVWEDTFPLRGTDGVFRWFLSRATPIRDATGAITRWFGTNTDVTELREIQGQLSEANRLLSTSAKQLGALVVEPTASLVEAVAQMEEFCYTVSHDLRAPLRGLQLYSDALLEDFAANLPSEARQWLSRISVNAKLLDKMILDVLTFSRLARAELKMEKVDLEKLVRRIVEQYPGLQPPQAEIQVEKLPPVLGHEPSLTQAVSNLLNNAVKFVAPGVRPKIRIWHERNNGTLRLWIADNGIGIDPKYQHRLFKMFERIHPRGSYEGTGVGLAIVRKAVERMGGKVGLESDGANGSRFWFEIKPA
jgi:PAS domain S-box-containing protein